MFEETRVSLEQEHSQDGGIPEGANYRYRNAVYFRIAAVIHHRTIFGADAHAVVGCDFEDGHINGDQQTDDRERNKCNCDS